VRLWLRRAAQATVVVALVCGSAKLSPAQGYDPRREISSAEDFRVRVGAALALGRSRAEGSRQALEKALHDPHPTVRTAAGAALAAVGDAAAIPGVVGRLSSESSDSVRSQLRNTLATLRGKEPAEGSGGGGGGKARYALQLGAMRNMSGVRGPELGNILRESAQKRVSGFSGAMLVEAPTGSAKGMPVLVLDGTLTRLAQKDDSRGNVGITAQVEFTVRKVPENVLKGALSGAATSIGTAKSIAAAPKRVQMLQDQAVEGAVESAMRGADQGLLQAAK
jgi:hypothetical protein